MTSHRLLRESNIPVVLSPGKVCLQASVRVLFLDPLRDCHHYPHFIDEETRHCQQQVFNIVEGRDRGCHQLPSAWQGARGREGACQSLRAGLVRQGHNAGTCLLSAWLCAECFSQSLT